MNKPLLNLMALFFAVASFVLIGPSALSQDKPADGKSQSTPAAFQRQIFVPMESLDNLLEGNSNRVLLSRVQYDQLLKAAQTREIKRAPLDSAIIAANYTGQVSGGVALIQGELIVESLNEGLVQIPLPFSGVAIRAATLGDQPAHLWRTPKGQIVLLTSNQSRQTLRVELTVAVQTTAARQSLSFQLPSPSATRFQLAVAGNVEVKSGVAVAQRVYDSQSDATNFDLLATRGPMNIVMSLNNRLLKDEQVTVSRSVLIHRLTANTQEMHLTCSMNVIHGAVEKAQFTVPAGFQVSHVWTQSLSQWEMKDPPQDTKETGKRLVVKLRQPTREDFVLNISAVRNEGAAGQWQSADIRPVDVAGHVSVVGVLADIELKSAKLVSDGVIPIDHAFLMAAIPESVKSARRRNPATVVAAFYAPQKDYSIASFFSVPKPELIVKSNTRLVIGDQSLQLQGGISLLSRHDARFGFKMKLPKLWRLNELTGVDGKPLRFDRVGVDGSSEFLVRLPTRISSAASTKVFFRASKTPDGWLERWKSNQVEFPTVVIEGQTKHTGAIAVSTDGDLSIKPADSAKLELLDEADKLKFDFDRANAPLAYQFENSDYQLSLGLTRLKPSLMARTYNYVRIQPTQMNVHAELVYDVKQAGEREFKFELPLDSPKSISIRSAKQPLKDYQSQDTQTARRWTVQLAKPKRGKVHLLIDYQVPLKESDLGAIELAPVLVNDVAFQSSMFAVEGSSELDIEIDTEGRAVDIGEFAEAVYQPGRYLLGAYSWPNEDLSLVVKSVRRPIYQLPSAIVQRAQMVTSISNHGKSQTAARFRLVTKQQPFLRVELPQDATLWSVQLDGEPAKPQLQDGALLISLIGNKTGEPRDLQLVFESPADAFTLVGEIQSHAPTLWLNATGEADDDTAVPLVDLHWRLIMPEGYSVSHSDGNFQSDQLTMPRSPIGQLGEWVYRLGGGVGTVRRVSGRAAVSGRAPYFGDVSQPMVKSNPLVDAQNELDFKNNGSDPSVNDELALSTEEYGEPSLPSLKLPQALNPPQERLTEKAEQEMRGFGGGGSGIGGGVGGGIGGALGGGGDGGFGGGVDPTQSQARKKANLWALSGLRSLNIQLTDAGNAIEFYNLGEQPVLTATVVNKTRLNWIAIALAILIAALGVLLTGGKLKSKVLFLVVVLSIACLLPLVGVWFDTFGIIVDLVILAVVFVACYFVVAGLIKLFGRSFTLVAKRIPLYLLLIALSFPLSFAFSFANQAGAQEVVNDATELKRLIAELQSDPEVKLPNDAVIIPFDADDPRGPEKADRLLLPYRHYLNLMNRAESPTQSESNDAPVDFVLSSADYALRLTLDDDLLIHGTLVIELMTDDPVAVALPLTGGALADAKVDGKPAKLQFQPVANQKQPLGKKAARKQSSQQQSNPPRPSKSNVVQLHLQGRGTKTFEFTVQIKPDRQGGWRVLNARLPVGLTRALEIKSLEANTEIRLNSDSDRRQIEATANQQIATVLNADGWLRLQWKPSTATQTIDQSLTAQSEAVFDVREDGLRLTWRVDLDFRGAERDVFTLNLPDGFLVEQVSGENVRAWDVQQDGDSSRLNVTTLSTAKDKEAFTIELSQRDFVVGQSVKEFDAPYLTVQGAALHKGVYTIRKSPIIEVKTTKQTAANRIDKNQFECRIDVGGIDAKSSPLGIAPFQVLQFVTTPFQIGLQANLVPRSINAQTQSVLRIGQSAADLEMRIKIAVGKRPLYKISFELPKDVEIRKLTAGLQETWTSETTENVQRVELLFPSGVAKDFSIVLDAALTAYSGQAQWAIPKVKINDVRKQNGYMAIQVDPALSVSTTELKNCESVLLKQVEAWLNRDQRSVTRAVLRTRGDDYDATLRLTKIQPRVTVQTVTNVRTTLFAIEETILLDFNIQQAGIRKIQFLLPATMRNARINAKLVSETIIDDVADNADVVRVTLNLQDDVIDLLRVVVENDRQLNAGRQSVPVPTVLTGVSEQRFVTLQNAGRDEISVLPSADFQPLNRQLKQFSQLKQKLDGGEVTMAYVAANEKQRPLLEFETKQRAVFDTVAASIEFSKTTMVVDSSGAYRALQNFQVNNRSEQYLEIELPEGARLLTVLVEGQPVKPVDWPAARNQRRLRIPLVKTQLGDLDYPVQLKYGGRLGQFSNFREVEFPVIETLNINVQLSQLHLRLPRSHRWMNFGGTMTKVDDRGKLEEGYLSYKSRQIQQLAEQIQLDSSTSRGYAQKRAYRNLRKLKSDMDNYQSNDQAINPSGGRQVMDMVTSNNDAIVRAEESFREQNAQQSQLSVDNRANFNNLILGQSARIARNSVNKATSNFFQPQSREMNQQMGGMNGMMGKDMMGRGMMGAGQTAIEGTESLDYEWLSRNQLRRSAGEALLNETAGAANRWEASAHPEPSIVAAQNSVQDGFQVDDSISYYNPRGTAQKRSRPNQAQTRLKRSIVDDNPFGNDNQGEAKKEERRDRAGMFAKDADLDDDVFADGDTVRDLALGDVGNENGLTGSTLGEERSDVFGSSLSSLNIELPERGVDYYFKSPRGKATVIVRPLETKFVSRWMSVVTTLGVCLGLGIVCWFGAWFWRKPKRRLAGTIGLLLGGWISLTWALLPVYGLVALVAAVILIFDWATRAIWSDPTTAAE